MTAKRGRLLGLESSRRANWNFGYVWNISVLKMTSCDTSLRFVNEPRDAQFCCFSVTFGMIQALQFELLGACNTE